MIKYWLVNAFEMDIYENIYTLPYFSNRLDFKSFLWQKVIFIRGVKTLSLDSVCAIMWKDIVEGGKQLMTIWRMHFGCWIRKTTSRHVQIV